jgi:ribosomal protein S18 acetylase RimI-like enzyme
MDDIKIVKITYENDLKDLKAFFEIECGSSNLSFTYFNKRGYEVIKNHLLTNLLYVNNQPAGYSHLDKDGENIWFGICIAEKYKGKKLGEKLIIHTLQQANENNIKNVLLSVYKDNLPAIRLYEKLNFKVYTENELSFFMIKEL